MVYVGMPESIETQLGLLEEVIGTLLTADTTDRRGHLQGELQKGFKALRGLLDVEGGVGKGPVYTPVRLDAPPPSADPTDEVQCLGISAPSNFPAQRKRPPKPKPPQFHPGRVLSESYRSHRSREPYPHARESH